jgi:hypothetical protein
MASDHYWVVTCKNITHHAMQNPLHGHRIPIGKTDAHSPRPATPEMIAIQCDDPTCRNTYPYTASEIIRWLGDVGSFSSHPLFVAEKCNVEFRDGKPMCTVHPDVELKETGAIEMHPPHPSPHSYQPTSYFCPISGQQFPHIKGVPPLR